MSVQSVPWGTVPPPEEMSSVRLATEAVMVCTAIAWRRGEPFTSADAREVYARFRYRPSAEVEEAIRVLRLRLESTPSRRPAPSGQISFALRAGEGR